MGLRVLFVGVWREVALGKEGISPLRCASVEMTTGGWCASAPGSLEMTARWRQVRRLVAGELEGGFGAAAEAGEQAAEGAEEGAGGEDGGGEKDECGGGGGDGVVGGEPGDADGDGVFGGGEGDVREGFGAGGDGGADGVLGAVGEKRDAGAGGGGEQLHAGREVVGGLVGDEGGDGDANEGVEGVPDEIEGGDLVDDELGGEEQAGGDEDPGVREGVEARGESDPVEAVEQAEGEDGGVDVEPGGEAGGDDEGSEIGRGEGHVRDCRPNPERLTGDATHTAKRKGSQVWLPFSRLLKA